jgi:hypothetical protein
MFGLRAGCGDERARCTARDGRCLVLRAAMIALLSGLGCTAPSNDRTPVASSSPDVGGITLLKPKPEILHFCQRAANRLGWPVPCPSLLPAHHLFSNTELCKACLPDGIFLIQEVFQGPPSYVGMPQIDGSVSHVGHLNIWSTLRGTLDAAGLGCTARGRTGGTIEVRGEAAQWVTCPAVRNPPQDSGHVMLEWSVAGIVYAVSVHTDSPVNLSLALFIAQHLVLVEPSSEA